MPTVAIAPIARALEHHGPKTPVGSVLRTSGWAKVPTGLRNAAQFSAGVESARVLHRIQSGVGEILSHYRNEQGAITDRSGLIRDITSLAVREGLTPADPNLRGGLQDITSEIRAELIVQQQVSQAYGFAHWKTGQVEDILDAMPAQELVRIRQAKVPRNWLERWARAGGRLYDGRMIALKTDPIWTHISRFGNPWPPYDFGSGMWVEDVSRYDAQRYGLIQPHQRLAPVDKAFDAQLEKEVSDLSPELRQNLQSLFGPQVEIDGQKVKWKSDVSSYERVSHDQRQVARQVFARSASDLGSVRFGEDGTQSASATAAGMLRAHAVEISAVASGRKPLFHERVSAYADPQLIKRLQATLPPGVQARADGDSLYVWNSDLVSRLADPNRPVWDQVREHADDGLWLGYGQSTFGGRSSVVVAVLGPDRRAVAGFWTPRETADLYGAARARDYADATGMAFTYEVLP